MKEHSTWRTKKGSILYSVMILILCSSLLVHQNRLIQSHLYIQRGIYSLDLEIDHFRYEMDKVEIELNLQFEDYTLFEAQMNKNKSISVLNFDIKRDSMYNEYDILMLWITEQESKVLRKVIAESVEGKIKLNVREV